MFKKFNNTDCKEKQLVRNSLYDLFKDKKTIFSLPAGNFLLELELMKLGIDVYTVEKDREVYVEGLCTLYSNKFDVQRHYNMSILEYFGQSDIMYDGMYLDYCGHVSTNINNTFAALNNLRQGGIIAQTFMFAREKSDCKGLLMNFTRKKAKEINHKLRLEAITSLLERLGLKNMTHYFYVGNNGVPMCTFISKKV